MDGTGEKAATEEQCNSGGVKKQQRGEREIVSEKERKKWIKKRDFWKIVARLKFTLLKCKCVYTLFSFE